MEHWIFLKAFLVANSGIDRDALHIFGALGALLIIAAVLRRPLCDGLPWLVLFLCELLNESTNVLVDGRVEHWELMSSLHDLLIAMSVPTVLLIVWRYAPWLFDRPEPRLLQPDWSIFTDASRREPPIEYADWEEIPSANEQAEDIQRASRGL